MDIGTDIGQNSAEQSAKSWPRCSTGGGGSNVSIFGCAILLLLLLLLSLIDHFISLLGERVFN